MIDTLLLTVLLRHDQSKNLDEIQARGRAGVELAFHGGD
ncbi:hypothetical protein ACLBVR_30800, partial [Pseudomonas aeruginosa]